MTKILSKASGFLALLGALLTLAFMFVAFNASGARVSSPSDIAGLELWLDALEECRGVADGTATAQWDDQSGNARHATQATGSAQPTCQTAAGDLVNGKPVLDFDGSDDEMDVADNAVFDGDASLTIFVVAAQDALTINQTFVSKEAFDTDNSWAFQTHNTASDEVLFFTATSANDNGATRVGSTDANLTAGVFRVLSVVYDGAQAAAARVNLRGDGLDFTEDVTGTPPATLRDSAASVRVGAFSGTLDRNYNGKIAEILVYSGALSDTNRRAVEKLLRMKWLGERHPAPAFFVSGKLPAKQQSGNCTDSNVAAWLSMDEASGNLTVPSGCAAAATVMTATGSPTYGVDTSDGPFGGLGSAVDFNGTNAYFTSTSDVDALDIEAADTFSIEVWFRTDDVAGTHGCFAGKMTAAGATSTGWCFYHSGPNTQFFLRDAEADQTSCVVSTGLIAGRWHYFRAYGTPQSVSCHLDGAVGTPTANASVGSVANTAPFEVGHTKWTQVTQFVDGAVAALRVRIGSTTSTLFNGPAYSGFSGSTLAAPTFTRVTASTRYNPVNGYVEAVRAGVPVVGSPLSGGDDGSIDGTEPTGVYVGSATSFVLLQNEDLSNAAWTNYGTPVVATNVGTAPDGTATADSVEDDAAGAEESRRQNVTVTADTSWWTTSVWVRCPTTAQTVRLYFALGVVNNVANHTCSPTWTKLVVSLQNNGYTAASVYLAPTDSTAASTGTAWFWRPQMYNKAFAVPLDPAVTSSAVTVNADVLSPTPATWAFLPNLNTVTVCAWVNPSTLDTGAQQRIFSTNDNNGSYLLRFGQGTGRVLAHAVSGTSVTGPASTALTANTWGHACGVFDQPNSTVTAYTGGQGTASASGGWTSVATSSPLHVGHLNGGSSVQGFLSDFRIYGQALSPQQIRALYLSKSSLYASRDLSPRERLRRKVMLASAAPLDMLWGIFSERRMEQERIDSAKRYVRSPDFPQPTWVMPQEASAP